MPSELFWFLSRETKNIFISFLSFSLKSIKYCLPFFPSHFLFSIYLKYYLCGLVLALCFLLCISDAKFGCVRIISLILGFVMSFMAYCLICECSSSCIYLLFLLKIIMAYFILYIHASSIKSFYRHSIQFYIIFIFYFCCFHTASC